PARPHLERSRQTDPAAARPGGAAAPPAPQPAALGRAAGGGGARGAGGIDLAPGGATPVPALTRNALVRLLAERSWTDVELAARAGLDRAYVNQVKNGRALPTVATALALARALGLPVAAVFPPGSSDPRLRLGSGRTAGMRPDQ